jgi:hypothetical protein
MTKKYPVLTPEERIAYDRAAHVSGPFVDNALRAAGDAGRIAVAVASKSRSRRGGAACVLIRNDGLNVEVLEQHKLAEKAGPASNRVGRFRNTVPEGKVRVAVEVASWGRIVWTDVPMSWGEKLDEEAR